MKMKTIRNTSFALLFCLPILVVSPVRAGVQGKSGTSSKESYDSVQVSRGAKAWANYCVRCHNYRDPGEKSDKDWHVAVNHMRTLVPLPGKTARDIMAFLKASNNQTLANIQNSAASAQQTESGGLSGKDIFGETCIACHGANGKGALPGVPDFTSKEGPLAKPDDELLRLIKSGHQTPGSPIAMPPRGGNAALSDADLSAVLSFIRENFSQ